MPIIADSALLDYLEQWEHELLLQSTKTKFSKETLSVFLRGINDLIKPSSHSLLIHQYNQYEQLDSIVPCFCEGDPWIDFFESSIVKKLNYPKVFDFDNDQLQVFESSQLEHSKKLQKSGLFESGMKTCWFYVLKDSEDKVIATFTFFFTESRQPTPADTHFLKRCTLFLSILVQQKNLQDKILFDRQTFSLISASTNDAIWDWDIKTNRLWWSEGFEKLFGHKRSDLSPYLDSWTTLIHPEDHLRVTDSIRETIRSGKEKWVTEYRFKNIYGLYLDVVDQGHIVRDDKGRAIRVVGGMRDVTQRKINQEILAEQAALLNLARDAIIVRDLSNRICYWNKGAEKIYGYSAEEALDQEVHKLLFKDPTDYFKATEVTLKYGEWGGQLQQISKDHKIIYIEGSWTLVKDQFGQPKSILVINTDITDQISTQKQLTRAQRFESLNTLTSGLAHNLNNCLTPILLSLHHLKTKPELESFAKTFSIMEKSALRSTELVKQLMKYSKGDQLNTRLVSPSELINEVVNLACETFPKRISLTMQIEPEIYQIKADASQLHQVLLNLLINARDAIKENGEIKITAQNINLSSRQLGLNTTCGDFVKISVCDTGQGIEPKNLERIFDPFFTTKESEGGTGLGLSTSHTIIKNHQGFIRAHSTVGEGTTFEIYLPFKEDLCALPQIKAS